MKLTKARATTAHVSTYEYRRMGRAALRAVRTLAALEMGPEASFHTLEELAESMVDAMPSDGFLRVAVM